jgi:hypothetical protein
MLCEVQYLGVQILQEHAHDTHQELCNRYMISTTHHHLCCLQAGRQAMHSCDCSAAGGLQPLQLALMWLQSCSTHTQPTSASQSGGDGSQEPPAWLPRPGAVEVRKVPAMLGTRPVPAKHLGRLPASRSMQHNHQHPTGIAELPRPCTACAPPVLQAITNAIVNCRSVATFASCNCCLGFQDTAIAAAIHLMLAAGTYHTGQRCWQSHTWNCRCTS